CREFNMHLVEDAAQAMGTKDAAGDSLKFCGTLGVAGAFSFFPTKNLGCTGDGGLVVTDDADMADRIRALRNHGQRERYRFEEIGLNARLDALQAAILGVKLNHLDSYVARRREIAALYRSLFRKHGLDGTVSLPHIPPAPDLHSYHQFVIRTPMRDELKAFLADRGIGTAVYYPLPIHLQPAFEHLGYKPGDAVESERAAKEVLALPIFPELERDEVEEVVGAIADFFGATR
ncbi:MAG TPA: transcriptional regulator, partial [Proteobacteria bacterium]|nr:transcriptional regulator [Pseudomonadota bacterium]